MRVATRPHPDSRQVGEPLLPEPCRCEQPKRYLDEDEDLWKCFACGRYVTPIGSRRAARVKRFGA